jgi:hypothetical protein
MTLVSSIGRARHRAYLRSPEWRELRRLALERDGFPLPTLQLLVAARGSPPALSATLGGRSAVQSEHPL